jgi:S-adenosylmethionine hydrolase
MRDLIISLTTDFGSGSPYVAAMKGVILGINPWARIVDLSHQIPPQDLHHTAYFLRTVLPYFPPGPIHVIVVDPGVGTERAILHVEASGHRLLVPDNGCWTVLDTAAITVRRLAEPRFWRSTVSSTFHGRDIFAPTAAHLSLGTDPALLGPVMKEWVKLEPPRPSFDPANGTVVGQVQFVDPFGNLITNITSETMLSLTPTAPEHQQDRRTPECRVRIGMTEVSYFVRSYGAAEPGSLVYLFSSDGFLEVAVVQGNAARQLGVTVGTPVSVTRNEDR